jgi:hypothetical protein
MKTKRLHSGTFSRSEVNEDEVNVCSPQQNEFGQRFAEKDESSLAHENELKGNAKQQ